MRQATGQTWAAAAPGTTGRVGPWYDADLMPAGYGQDMDPLRPPLLRRLQPAHWFAIDCVITALLALVYAIGFGAPANLTGIPQWATT